MIKRAIKQEKKKIGLKKKCFYTTNSEVSTTLYFIKVRETVK
jgi:hypothetical protein